MAAGLAVGPALGGWARLSYHEAIVAQGAREILDRGDWLVPTVGGRPWLEKPPMAHWLVAAAGAAIGRIDEGVARLPSAVSAIALALIVGRLVAHRRGPAAGALAGLVQATAGWAVVRGRLADADLLLAALVAATLMAFDAARRGGRGARWAFFAALGATSLAKGLGFGGAIVVAVVIVVLIWDRRSAMVRRLAHPAGWALAAAIGLAWPLAVLARHPEALGLWSSHVADRLADRPAQFVGEPTWRFALSPLALAMPWTPLALIGMRASWRRAWRRPGGLDRLLWAWAVAPWALLMFATVKNDHYLIHALPPWSIWAAGGLIAVARRLRRARGGTAAGARVRAGGLAMMVAGAWGLGFATLGPGLDRRGAEWSWYAEAARSLRPGEPVAFLYDDWDRRPYPTPFGPVPHDLAVRLFYLGRPASWSDDPATLPLPAAGALAVIGRDRDRPALERLGRVEVVAEGPPVRRDRTYRLFRVEVAPVVTILETQGEDEGRSRR